jgi:hypothetical protein
MPPLPFQIPQLLLYNPLDLPCTANLPAVADSPADSVPFRVGCRVIAAEALSANLEKLRLPELHNPSFVQPAR